MGKGGSGGKGGGRVYCSNCSKHPYCRTGDLKLCGGTNYQGEGQGGRGGGEGEGERGGGKGRGEGEGEGQGGRGGERDNPSDMHV